MNDANLLYFPLLVPALTAVLCLGLRSYPKIQHVVGVGGALAGLVVAVWLVARVDAVGILTTQAGGWDAPVGITLVADRLAAGMVAISALVGFAVAFYALRAVWDGDFGAEFFPLYHLLLLGVQGAFLTGDLFNLYVWFEVMLVASFVLLTLGNRAVRAFPSPASGSLKLTS